MAKKVQAKNPLINTEPWKVTCPRFVGFIDIMGFKDIVSRNSHEEVYRKLMVISDYKDLAQNRYLVSDAPPKYFIFSDSIIIFSKDDSGDSIGDFLLNVGHLTQLLVKNGVPFRGGIACGVITVDEEHSIFFGQPLIDAYHLSEELAIYATAIHHTAEESILNDEMGKYLIFEYDTPLKTGKARQYLVSSFAYYFVNPLRDEVPKVKELMSKYRAMTSGTLRRYIDNTEIFLEMILKIQYELEEAEKRVRRTSEQ